MIPHTYDTIYYDLFIHFKDSIKIFFKYCICSDSKKYSANISANASPGASLRAWRDFFIKATIYGGDIDSKVLFTEKE